MNMTSENFIFYANKVLKLNGILILKIYPVVTITDSLFAIIVLLIVLMF